MQIILCYLIQFHLQLILRNFNLILIKTGILLNLSKAFDTVNNNILFIKLKDYRLFGSISHGLKVTLQKEKKLGSTYNGHRSDSKRIGCGVAQDAISGPLFFPIYVNDLCNVSKILEFMMALMYTYSIRV